MKRRTPKKQPWRDITSIHSLLKKPLELGMLNFYDIMWLNSAGGIFPQKHQLVRKDDEHKSTGETIINITFNFNNNTTMMDENMKENMLKGMFAGATFNNSVVVGLAEDGSSVSYQTPHDTETPTTASSEQVAQALESIVGDDQPINVKWKWAGAYWWLRWANLYPVDVPLFCRRINGLPFMKELPVPCGYNDIRRVCSMRFMEQDPRHMEMLQPSSDEAKEFYACREVALRLSEELKKTLFAT